MQILTLDFETYFDDEYSLKKMTQEAYIRDSRFQAHGAAIRWPHTERIEWYDEPTLREILRDIDWGDTALLCHHAQFDGLILSHVYGIRPAFWFCTYSMATLMLGNHIRVGLDKLAELFALPAKSVPYQHFKGHRWHQIASDTQRLVAEGACHDCFLTWAIFQKLMTGAY